jgi:hypothetical protein
MKRIRCKVIKFFGAYQEYEKGDIVELPEQQFQQLKNAGTVEPINFIDDAQTKMYQDGKNKNKARN